MKNISIKALVLILALNALSFEIFGQITRIRFARGRTSTSMTGTLRAMGERSYVLGARAGQNLSATVSSRNNCIMFGNTTTSTNYVTERGDNYFNLMNRCRYASTFTLTVSID
jgi:hypothetical protein